MITLLVIALFVVALIAAYALIKWYFVEYESKDWKEWYDKAIKHCDTVADEYESHLKNISQEHENALTYLYSLIDDADADIAFLKANTTDIFMELQASQMQFFGAHKEVERLTAELEKAQSDIKRYIDRPKCPKCHRFLKNGVCSNAKCQEHDGETKPADLTDAPFDGLEGVKKGDYVLFSDGVVRKVVHIDRTMILPQAIKVMPFVDDELCYFNIGHVS